VNDADALPASVMLTAEMMPGSEHPTPPRTVELRDGREAVIRPVAPQDKELFVRGFDQLGPESGYRRFLTSKTALSPRELEYLTEVDHRDHVALIALDAESGEAVGVARFVRERPGGDSAEVAVTVVDDWQGRGLGTGLMEALTERARESGLRAYTATVAADNAPMIEHLERIGALRAGPAEGGAVQYAIELLPAGLGETLKSALRAAAEDALRLHLTMRRVLLDRAELP